MSTAAVCSLGVISFAGIVCLSMWGCPRYEVYSQNMQGEAELARASQNRQIKKADTAFRYQYILFAIQGSLFIEAFVSVCFHNRDYKI